MLFRDRVCLWLNTVRLEHALATARDMRSVTKTAIVGPSFLVAQGPHGARALSEMGIHDVIYDLRLIGDAQEVWQCVMEAAKHGAKGISIHALAGAELIRVAVTAAEASKAETFKLQRPQILVNMLPACISDTTMVDEVGMRVRRTGHLTCAVTALKAAGADGMIVEYGDMRHLKSAKVPLLVYSQKGVTPYTEVERAELHSKPGIRDILRAGGSHAIFDSTFVMGKDVEWAADMIGKELASLESSAA